MKNILLILCLLGSSSYYQPLFGQLSKGQVFLNGSLSFYNESYRGLSGIKTSSNNMGVGISGGRFFTDKMAYTLGANLYSYKNEGFSLIYTPVESQPNGQLLYIREQAATKNKYTSTDLSIGLNRYIRLKERLVVVLSGNVVATFQKNDYTEQVIGKAELNITTKRQYYSLKLSPGLIYFLSPHFGLGGYFGGFNLQVMPKSNNNSASSISADFSTSGVFGIGLNYFFK
jgi:hypothetical protein